MTKSGGVICQKYIVLFFYKKSINAKLQQKKLIHKLCNQNFCRIFVGGFFIKKNFIITTHLTTPTIYTIFSSMGDIILIIGIIVIIVAGMVWFTRKVDDL